MSTENKKLREIIEKVADPKNWEHTRFINKVEWIGEDYIWLDSQKCLKELEAGNE